MANVNLPLDLVWVPKVDPEPWTHVNVVYLEHDLRKHTRGCGTG